jgi:hypothetical protein
VAGYERKAKVEALCREASGHPPGSSEYLGHYQTVLAKFVKGLPKKELEKYQAMAKEWTERSPPPELQRK